jgi:hypothetical protein
MKSPQDFEKFLTAYHDISSTDNNKKLAAVIAKTGCPYLIEKAAIHGESVPNNTKPEKG